MDQCILQAICDMGFFLGWGVWGAAATHVKTEGDMAFMHVYCVDSKFYMQMFTVKPYQVSLQFYTKQNIYLNQLLF